MNSIDFCFWLQGYFELSEADALTDNQVKIIKNHLRLAFVHEIDDLREKELKDAVKAALQGVHDGDTEKPDKIPAHRPNDTLFRC